MGEQQIRTFLGGFDFRGDKVHEPINTFSGGEKTRLALAMVAFSKPNLLLLDEPTNHLDMDMRQALTIALQDFDGAILLVSHDRHLLANTVDTFLLVEDGVVQIFEGDLEDYRLRLLGRTSKTPSKSIQKPAGKKSKAGHKEARQLRTRIKTLESRLERLQRKLSEVEAKLADSAMYQEDQVSSLQNLVRDQLSLENEITQVEEQWLEGTEALESLQ
jgi:ATP-binding cassette subfamily F protein 3